MDGLPAGPEPSPYPYHHLVGKDGQVAHKLHHSANVLHIHGQVGPIDGGGVMKIRSIYVHFPKEKLKRELSAAAIIKARDWWQYENGGGQVRK